MFKKRSTVDITVRASIIFSMVARINSAMIISRRITPAVLSFAK